MLVARSWQDYAGIVTHLLQDQTAYAAACARASALAQAMADQAAFAAQLTGDLELIVRAKPPWLTKLAQQWLPAAMRRLFDRKAIE